MNDVFAADIILGVARVRAQLEKLRQGATLVAILSPRPVTGRSPDLERRP